MKAEVEADTQGAARDYAAALHATQAEAHEAVASAADACRQLHAAQTAAASAEERRDDLARAREVAEGKVRHFQGALSRVKEASKDNLASFGGQRMVQLAAQVQRARGQFHQPPIGPVGAFLSLSDSRCARRPRWRGPPLPRLLILPVLEAAAHAIELGACRPLTRRWGRTLEVALGLHLHTFLAHDSHDCAILNRMMNQLGMKGEARALPRPPHGAAAFIQGVPSLFHE